MQVRQLGQAVLELEGEAQDQAAQVFDRSRRTLSSRRRQQSARRSKNRTKVCGGGVDVGVPTLGLDVRAGVGRLGERGAHEADDANAKDF